MLLTTSSAKKKYPAKNSMLNASAIYMPVRTTKGMDDFSFFPINWAIIGVPAIRSPIAAPSKGKKIPVPTETPAKSSAPAWPAIVVFIKLIPMVESCATKIGNVTESSFFISLYNPVFIFLSLNHHQKRRRASDFGFLKLVEPSILISCTSLLIQASCPICRTSMVNQEDFL